MRWKKSLMTAKVPKVFENRILPGKFCGYLSCTIFFVMMKYSISKI